MFDSFKALVLKKKDLVFALLQVIKHLSENLKKMNSRYRWKFTVTAVDCLVQVVRESSGELDVISDVGSNFLQHFLKLPVKHIFRT